MKNIGFVIQNNNSDEIKNIIQNNDGNVRK